MSRAALIVVVEVLGLLLIVAGVTAVYWPAALMVAGAACVVIAWRQT
jgi:hypothetical protein